MAIKKTNKAGHVFGGHIGGVDYFRQDDGKWTDSGGTLVEPGYAKILDQFFPQEVEDENTPPPPKKKRKREPVIEPEKEDKPKKKGKKKKEEQPKEKTTKVGRFGRAALKTMFPGPYEAAEKFRELWTGKDREELSANPFNYKPIKSDDGESKEPLEGKNKKSGKLGRFGKAAIEGIFPGVTKTASSAKKLWTGDEEPEDKAKSKKKNKKKDKEEQVDLSEQKRQAAEKRFQYNKVEDSLKDNADLLRDVIAIQERSSEILSQIASSIGKMGGGGPDIPGLGGGGGGSGGNKGAKPKGKGFNRKTKMIAGGLAAAAAVGGVAYSLSDNKDEEVDMSPSSESPPQAAEVQGPPAPPSQAAPVSKPSIAPKPLNRAQKALTGNIGSEENTKRQAELSGEYSDAKKAEDDIKKEMMDFEKEQKKSGAKTKQVASKWGDWDEQYEDPEIQKKSKELKSKAYEASEKTQAIQSEAENRGAYGENKLDEDVFGNGERSKLDTSNDLPAVIDALKRDFGMTNEQIAKIGGGTLTSSVEGDEKTTPGKRTRQSFTFKNSKAVLELYKKKVKEKLEGKVTVPAPPDTSEEAAPKLDAEVQGPPAPPQNTSPQSEITDNGESASRVERKKEIQAERDRPPISDDEKTKQLAINEGTESQAVPVSKPEPTSKKISGVGNEEEDKIFKQLMEEAGNPTDLDWQKDLRDEAGMRLKANKVSGALGQTPLTGNGSQSASGILKEGKVVSATGQSLAEKAETSGIEEARNRGPQATSTPEIISYKADQIKFNADKLTFEVQSLNVEMKQTASGQQAAATGGASGVAGGTPSAGGTGSGGGGGTGAPGGSPQATQTGAPSVAGPAGGVAPTQGGPGVSSTDTSAPTYTPGGGRNIPTAAPALPSEPSARQEKSPGVTGEAPAAGSGKPLAGGKSFSEQAPDVMAKLQKDFGLSKEQAAGIVGNLGHESAGLQAGIQEKGVKKGRGGLGWAQWTGPRRREFEKYLKETGQEATDPNANYGFLKKELETTHKSSLTAIKKETTVAGATKAFEAKYEAAGVKHMESREKYANQAMKLTDEAEKKKATDEAKAQTAQEDSKKKEAVEPAGTAAAPAAVQQQQAEATRASETAPNKTPPAPPPEVAEKLETKTETPAAKEKVAEAAKPGTDQTRAAEKLSAPPVVIAAGGQPTAPPAVAPNWNAKQIERNPSLKQDATQTTEEKKPLAPILQWKKDRERLSGEQLDNLLGNETSTPDAKPEMSAEDKKALAGEDLSQPNAVPETSTSPSVSAGDLTPPEEPAAVTAAAPAQTGGGGTQQAAAEKPDDKPSATGGEFIGKLSRTLPYLSMAVVTGQQQALHSVNQHLQARR
jgi:hypothetical protein